MNSFAREKAVVGNIKKHISNQWPTARIRVCKWPRGPVDELGIDFAVLGLSPTQESNNLWVYCTAGTGMVKTQDCRQEFLLLSSSSDPRHVETLTMVSHYHRFESPLSLGHVVPIGQPWNEGSRCDRLLMSLPYPFGPKLEWLRSEGLEVRFLWALPITPGEAACARQNGIEALERSFDAVKLCYWDSTRKSVV